MPPTPSGLRIANRPTTLPVNDPGSDAAAPAFEMSGMLRAQSSVLRCAQFYSTSEQAGTKYIAPPDLWKGPACERFHGATQSETLEAAPPRMPRRGFIKVASPPTTVQCSILRKSFCAPAIFLDRHHCTYTNSCPISGLDCLSNQPRNFSFSKTYFAS